MHCSEVGRGPEHPTIHAAVEAPNRRHDVVSVEMMANCFATTGNRGRLAMKNDVTAVLSAIEQGDPRAAEELLPLVYDELRKLAAQKLVQEKPGQTLQATALVHEAYLRLVTMTQDGTAAATSSRLPRRRCAASWWRTHAARPAPRRGVTADEFDVGAVELAIEGPPVHLLALDEALTALEARDERKANLVRLRFFAGLSIEQAARALGISVATANNDWSYAKSWLRLAMTGDGPNERRG